MLDFCRNNSLAIFLFLGAIGMFTCMVYRRKMYSLSLLQCALLALLLTLVGVAGAKLMFAAENRFQSWDGVSFFGSVYLIPILMPLIGFLFRKKPGQVMDICAPCVAFMIACLRINCFISGCCGGWTICISSICFSWPTQMMDSIGDLAIMCWMLKREERKGSDGKLYPYFLVAYGALRFFIEFLRDTPKDWLTLSHGQCFSLVAAFIGLLWLRMIKQKEQQQ